MSDAFMKGSAATLSPTCFMQTRLRFPAYDMPSAASRAVFSLVLQAERTVFPGSRWARCINSVISVEGVPGYAYTPEIPASNAPCAMASAPSNSFVNCTFFIFVCPCLLYETDCFKVAHYANPLHLKRATR